MTWNYMNSLVNAHSLADSRGWTRCRVFLVAVFGGLFRSLDGGSRTVFWCSTVSMDNDAMVFAR